MKLVYRLEDKLFWIHNFLPQKFYKELHTMVFKNHRQVDDEVKNSWEKNLIQNLESPFKFRLADYFSKQYNILLRHQPFLNLTKSELNFTVHKMIQKSGINWHSDGNYKCAATFYINHKWNHQWGGEFMFKNETSAGFIPVIGNSLILIKTPLMHKVNPVLSPLIPRFTIQTFIK